MTQTLPDGLIALRNELKLAEIMRLIECTARWVDPATFQLLPIWYPEFARGTYFYNGNWSEPRINTNRETGHKEHKREGNLYANKSLTHALGLRSTERPNWSCCHIWGIDDASYQQTNAVVQDRKYYSCIANMVLLPSPLKAFTDAMPEVKTMLRICARHLYGWHCGHESVRTAVTAMDQWDNWDAYPPSWPHAKKTSTPRGLVKLDEKIRRDAVRRLAAIRSDLENAGPNYPKQEVRDTLKFWDISI
jgi:hypothetical protein